MLGVTNPIEGAYPSKKRGAFSGGLVTSRPPHHLARNQSPNCLNCYADEHGILRKRLGDTKATEAVGTAAANGIAYYKLNSTTEYICYFGDADELKIAANSASGWATTMSDITWGTKPTASLLSIAHSAVWDTSGSGVLLMTWETRDTPQYWDGNVANPTADISANCPDGKFIVVWKNHVWIANTAADPDILQWSALNSYTDWTGSRSGSESLRTQNDLGITGLHVFEDKLYVFKERSIIRITYTNSTPIIARQDVIDNIGTLAPKTIKTVTLPGGQKAMVFLDSNSVLRMSDGYSFIDIGSSIQKSNGESSYYLDNILPATHKYCHACIEPAKSWYMLFFSNGGGAVIQYFVYDFRQQVFWLFTAYDLTGDGTIDGFLNTSLYCSNGNTTTPGSSVFCDTGNGYIRKMHTGYNDTYGATGTAAISSYWSSPRYDGGQPGIKTKIREMLLEMLNVDAYNLDVEYRLDWDSDWVDLDTITIDEEFRPLHVGVDGYLFQVKLSDRTSTQGYEIYDMYIYGEKEGVQL